VTHTIPAPTITALNPTSGSTAGGTSVVITGTAFTGASSVKFGTNNATTYTVNSDTQITATSPAGSAGTVDVTVTTSHGTSAIVYEDQFTYTGSFAPIRLATSGGGNPTLMTSLSQATRGSNFNPTSQTGSTSPSFAASTSGGPSMAAQFLISGTDLIVASEKASSWTNGSWVDQLGNSWQFAGSSSAESAASTLIAPFSPGSDDKSVVQLFMSRAGLQGRETNSGFWSHQAVEDLPSDIVDFLFAHEPGTMPAEVRAKKIARMIF
jgi:hypothetical protein